MQYVEGQPLSECHESLSIEHKVQIMRDVCKGLQSAHTEGLVHRDIKPSNILITQTDDGHYHPIIIDFGLAFKAANEHCENHHAGLGTPAFMAPEQVRYSAEKTDRRVDVFSVGACLHYLMWKTSPNVTTNMVIERAQQDANVVSVPAKIKSADEAIASDLRAVILTCVEAQPNDRYSSAKQVADELDRYLRGEPVKVISGKGYWVRKKFKQHWLVISLLILIAISLTSFASWSWYQQHQQQERELILQDFTTQVESLEAQVRYSDMSPVHDTQPDRLQWQNEITKLAQTIVSIGPLAIGPGNYASGRMHYTLGDYQQSLNALEQAERSGYTSARLNYAKGLTLSALYRQHYQQAMTILNSAERDKRIQEITEQYQQPAITALEQSKTLLRSTWDVSYVTALVHYLTGEFELALQVLKQATGLPQWRYEKQQLLAQIQLASAAEQQAPEQVERLLNAGITAANNGLAIAANNPELHQVKLTLLFSLMQQRTYQQGKVEDVIPVLDNAVNSALRSVPWNLEIVLLTMELQSQIFKYQSLTGQQYDKDALENSIQSIHRYRQQWPDDTRFFSPLLKSYHKLLMLNQSDSVAYERLLSEVNELESSAQYLPMDYRFYASLGQFYNRAAAIVEDAKLTREYRRRSMKAVTQAYQLNPQHMGLVINLAIAKVRMAQQAFAPSMVATLQEAKALITTALASGQYRVPAYRYAVNIEYALTQWHHNVNDVKSAEQSIQAAESALTALLALKPNYSIAQQDLSANHLSKIRSAVIAKRTALLDQRLQAYLENTNSVMSSSSVNISVKQFYFEGLLWLSEFLHEHQYQGRGKSTFAAVQTYLSQDMDGKLDADTINRRYVTALYTADLAQKFAGLKALEKSITPENPDMLSLLAKVHYQLATTELLLTKNSGETQTSDSKRNAIDYLQQSQALYQQLVSQDGRKYVMHIYQRMHCTLILRRQLEPKHGLSIEQFLPAALKGVELRSCS